MLHRAVADSMPSRRNEYAVGPGSGPPAGFKNDSGRNPTAAAAVELVTAPAPRPCPVPGCRDQLCSADASAAFSVAAEDSSFTPRARCILVARTTCEKKALHSVLKAMIRKRINAKIQQHL